MEDGRSKTDHPSSIFHPPSSTLDLRSSILFQIVVQVKTFDLVYGATAVEAFDHAGSRAAAEFFAQVFVRQQPRQRGDERMRAVAFDEEAGDAVFDNFGHSADAGRDDSAAGGHGLDQGQRESFVVGRRGDDIERAEQRGQVFDIAGKSQMVADVQSIGRLLQLVEVRFVVGAGFAYDQKFGVAPVTLSDQARRGFDKQVLTLEPRDLSDDADSQSLGN